MRLPPVLLEVALTIALWVAVLWLLRVRRGRMGDSPSPRVVRGHRLHIAAAITATVGVTWFVAWLLTDAAGPHWLHILSLPAAALFLAVGAVLAGYAGWIGGP